MSVNILNATFHILHKDAGQTDQSSCQINNKTETDIITEGYQQLINDICERYSGRGGKGHGYFEENQDIYPMQGIITDYLINKDHNFFDTTVRMIRVLEDKANTESFSTGGDVIFSHYQDNNHDFILVAIVAETSGSAKSGWDIERTTFFDIKNLKFAGRIDLTKWQNGDERYISFLKGSGNVSKYFKAFLGCDDTVIASKETKKIIEIINNFTISQNLIGEEKETFIANAFSYLTNLSNNEQEFEVEAFANHVWPNEPEVFIQVLNAEEMQLSTGFVPDKRSLNSLVKFKASSDNWKIEFERKALNRGIQYNADEQTLTISNLPPELIKSLNDEFNTETDDIIS